MKRKFYTAYNYGMGATIQIIHARNEEEVYKRFPKLLVFEPTAEWLEAHKECIHREYDVDGPIDELMKPFTISDASDPIKHRRILDRYSTAMHEFSAAHHLYVESYPKGNSFWIMRFIHPAGGQASIQVMASITREQLIILGLWSIDDYDRGTRSVTVGEKTYLDSAVNDTEFKESLKSKLNDIVSWRTGENATVHTGYKNGWHQIPRERFYASLNENLRLPQLGKNHMP